MKNRLSKPHGGNALSNLRLLFAQGRRAHRHDNPVPFVLVVARYLEINAFADMPGVVAFTNRHRAVGDDFATRERRHIVAVDFDLNGRVVEAKHRFVGGDIKERPRRLGRWSAGSDISLLKSASMANLFASLVICDCVFFAVLAATSTCSRNAASLSGDVAVPKTPSRSSLWVKMPTTSRMGDEKRA